MPAYHTRLCLSNYFYGWWCESASFQDALLEAGRLYEGTAAQNQRDTDIRKTGPALTNYPALMYSSYLTINNKGTNMPIIKSAKKRVKTAQKAAVRNSKTKRSIKGAVKAFQKALAGGEKTAGKKLSQAQSALDRAAKKNVMHKNKVARKKSQLAKAAKASAEASKSPVKKVVPKKTVAKKAPAKKPATKKTTKK